MVDCRTFRFQEILAKTFGRGSRLGAFGGVAARCPVEAAASEDGLAPAGGIEFWHFLMQIPCPHTLKIPNLDDD
jgi:hypothetical protein